MLLGKSRANGHRTLHKIIVDLNRICHAIIQLLFIKEGRKLLFFSGQIVIPHFCYFFICNISNLTRMFCILGKHTTTEI